jgi:GAF domain-containing protein
MDRMRDDHLKVKPGPAAMTLRPIMDTYMDSAVAVIGCNSRGIGRYACELDVLVVTAERRPSTSLRIGDVFVDLRFVSEKEALKPTNPEHAMSMATAKPVRDSSLVLSTSSAANFAIMADSARKASGIRLASALKISGRAESALAKGALIDADLWLLAASYEFGYALLLSKETLPSPSHLLAQLREGSRGNPRGFEGMSIGAGLESAGRAGCGARLEGVTVLHDVLREGTGEALAESEWPKERTEIMAAKADELVTRAELAECYSFLGQELVDGMTTLLRLHPKRTLVSLTEGNNRLLGERLVRQLGLARSEAAVRSGLETLKQQVSLLARRS